MNNFFNRLRPLIPIILFVADWALRLLIDDPPDGPPCPPVV
jgi:hypothetical protein